MRFGSQLFQYHTTFVQQLFHMLNPQQAIVLVQSHCHIAKFHRFRFYTDSQIPAKSFQSISIIGSQIITFPLKKKVRSRLENLKTWLQFNFVAGILVWKSFVKVGSGEWKVQMSQWKLWSNPSKYSQQFSLESSPCQPSSNYFLYNQNCMISLFLLFNLFLSVVSVLLFFFQETIFVGFCF